MYKFLIFILSGFFIINSFIFSNENNQTATVLYLVPELGGDYVVEHPMMIPGPFKIDLMYGYGMRNILSFSDSSNKWSLEFSAPGGAPLQVGNYEDATRAIFASEGHPGINFSGWGRSYGGELTSEFEVFEIEYDENNQVILFAADFRQVYALGSIRFNSSYPVKRHFIEGKLPDFDWESSDLMYLNKMGAEEGEALITLEGKKIETNYTRRNGLNLTVSSRGYQVKIYIPDAYDWEDEIFIGYGPTYYEYRHLLPSLTFLGGNGDELVRVEKGSFLIKELYVDHVSKKIISLAVDYYFQDENNEEYGGVIRVNSKVPTEINF